MGEEASERESRRARKLPSPSAAAASIDMRSTLLPPNDDIMRRKACFRTDAGAFIGELLASFDELATRQGELTWLAVKVESTVRRDSSVCGEGAADLAETAVAGSGENMRKECKAEQDEKFKLSNFAGEERRCAWRLLALVRLACGSLVRFGAKSVSHN